MHAHLDCLHLHLLADLGRRVAGAAGGLPAARRAGAADQRHEAAARVAPLHEAVAAAFVDCEHLVVVGTAQGDDQPPALRELLQQRLRRLVGGGRHEDAVEGRVVGPAVAAVRHVQLDVVVAEARQHGAGLLGQGRDALHGEHFAGQLGQHRGLIARAGAHLQHAAAHVPCSSSVMSATMYG